MKIRTFWIVCVHAKEINQTHFSLFQLCCIIFIIYFFIQYIIVFIVDLSFFAFFRSIEKLRSESTVFFHWERRETNTFIFFNFNTNFRNAYVKFCLQRLVLWDVPRGVIRRRSIKASSTLLMFSDICSKLMLFLFIELVYCFAQISLNYYWCVHYWAYSLSN